MKLTVAKLRYDLKNSKVHLTVHIFNHYNINSVQNSSNQCKLVELKVAYLLSGGESQDSAEKHSMGH